MALDITRHSAYTGKADPEVVESMVELLGDMDLMNHATTDEAADILRGIEEDYGKMTASAVIEELAYALDMDVFALALLWQYGTDRARMAHRQARGK